jgi:hypothetical protein
MNSLALLAIPEAAVLAISLGMYLYKFAIGKRFL